uniref:(northern house mosquito) hypothetical protein n=1 Tax=Culex pipiens TaxID=7175 RepID=A0A8D8KWH2_CULPI
MKSQEFWLLILGFFCSKLFNVGPKTFLESNHSLENRYRMSYCTHMFTEQDTLSLFRTKSPRFINRLDEVGQVVSTWPHKRTWARLGHGHTCFPLWGGGKRQYLYGFQSVTLISKCAEWKVNILLQQQQQHQI